MKNQLLLTKQLFSKLFIRLNENKISLFKSLFLAIIILVINSYYFENTIENPESELPSLTIFSMFILIIVYSILAINIHRILLLGTHSIPKIGIYTISKREFNYLLHLIGLYILVTLISIVPMMIVAFSITHVDSNVPLEFEFIVFIVSFILYYLLARFSLVFPSIAIDKAISFSDSWEYTKQYQILIIIGLVLFPLFVDFILSQLWDSIFHTSISSFIYFIETIFLIGILSLIYEYIVANTVKFEDREIEDIEITEYEKVFKVKIDNRHEVSFDFLKAEMLNQYKNLNYTNNVVDNDNSWMIKKSNDSNSYVSVNKDKYYFYIEVFNDENPDLEFLKNQESKFSSVVEKTRLKDKELNEKFEDTLNDGL